MTIGEFFELLTRPTDEGARDELACAIEESPGLVTRFYQDPWPSIVDDDVWLWAFDRAGYTSQYMPAARPSEPVWLYRGTTHEHRVGMSWTPCLDCARAYALRAHGVGAYRDGNVYGYLAQPQELLAHSCWRTAAAHPHFEECVLDTRLVRVESVLTIEVHTPMLLVEPPMQSVLTRW